MTIRQAVDVIARFGARPVSESALRSRIRSRRLGVTKINGRLYTNPLNLATAGLVPLELLTDSEVPAAIEDRDLHAWIGSAPPSLDDDPLDPGEWPESSVDAIDEVGEPSVDSSLEVDGGDEVAPVVEAPPLTQVPGQVTRRGVRLGGRRLLVGLAVLGVVAVLVGVLAIVGPGSSPPARGPMSSGARAVPVADPLARAAMIVAESAGDYRAALRFAADLDDPALADAVRGRAGRYALARSRAALSGRRLAEARRQVRVARSYRVPALAEAITRAKGAIDREAAARARRIRARAQARRQRAVPAATPSSTAVPSSGSGGSAASTAGGSSTGSTGGGSGSGGAKQSTRDPEFF